MTPSVQICLGAVSVHAMRGYSYGVVFWSLGITLASGLVHEFNNVSSATRKSLIRISMVFSAANVLMLGVPRCTKYGPNQRVSIATPCTNSYAYALQSPDSVQVSCLQLILHLCRGHTGIQQNTVLVLRVDHSLISMFSLDRLAWN